jgi:hypothetical protein
VFGVFFLGLFGNVRSRHPPNVGLCVANLVFQVGWIFFRFFLVKARVYGFWALKGPPRLGPSLYRVPRSLKSVKGKPRAPTTETWPSLKSTVGFSSFWQKFSTWSPSKGACRIRKFLKIPGTNQVGVAHFCS